MGIERTERAALTGTVGKWQLAPQEPPIAPITRMDELEAPSLLDIGKRAAMLAEREAIERVLAQTRWNRRQAAKI